MYRLIFVPNASKPSCGKVRTTPISLNQPPNGSNDTLGG